jgi:LAO/AO transport system kinase
VVQTLPNTRRLSAQAYIDGILNGDRVMLARAISVVESSLPYDRELAASILDGIVKHTGRSRRIGITGVPGAGKSTFIDRLGVFLIEEHKQKIAVLNIDPSSPVSGGSILGDKTRMKRLVGQPNAFIRPSPSRGHMGGVGRRTRETILLCEAADFENVVIETVGVGQSETALRSMSDFFLCLMTPSAGDELQGIKRGLIEMVDAVAVNKADGENENRAEVARTQYESALHLFQPTPDGWKPRIVAVSAFTGKGIPELWGIVLEHQSKLEANGGLKENRKRQALDCMRELLSEKLAEVFWTHAAVASQLPLAEKAILDGHITPFAAARAVMTVFLQQQK